ncbi:hypothetical protein GA0074695_1137 [Micromonospora viridifaciens]|uniref:Uncharacterized protein n=1 Tax=Micromonospora viridifaciens TaxID=1881 RepID=A0A1C4V534_MICVI|nr:hypothetical protein [Micromonospora viridifaciens]SCE79026.1 hypothetical protein GA0074695_1137 [Micromonospora viridifaciens]
MKAHRTDVVSFAFGLVFLALSAWWLLGRILGLMLPPVGWFLAGALILVGLLSLVGALRSGRHTDPEPARQGPAATVEAQHERGPEPTTRELPTIDAPERPAAGSATGGPGTDGGEPGRADAPAG